MLWGNLDTASGNQKPVFANTSNVQSNSTIHGSAANGNGFYGMTMGVSTGEQANSVGKPQQPAHSGWVSVKYGTGPVASMNISNGGLGINAGGYLLLTDLSAHGQGAGFNASFTIANSQNTMQSFSTNPLLNVVNTITIINGGTGWSNASAINVRTNGTNVSYPNIQITLGGRGGRVKTEVLVASGSISGDDPRDNVVFSGI